MKVSPDDELFRVSTVWLGPTGFTFPWTARYLAYATWLGVFLAILLVEAVTPLKVHVPPVWEICLSVLAAYGVLSFVTHERPLASLWQTLRAELRAPRPEPARTVEVVDRSTVPSHARPQLYTPRSR